MSSKWYHLKSDALSLRQSGHSIGFIEAKLGIPRSTLNYWFKNISLTRLQKERLEQQWKAGLVKARKKAILWHKEQKLQRLAVAKNEAGEVLKNIDHTNQYLLELALAFLYLGEGTKAKVETGMGSSNPEILKFFVVCLRKLYNVPVTKIRCELHLRADQDPHKMILYWSRVLSVPQQNFIKPHLDSRTSGSKTYKNYMGVCLVRCGTVAIQRRLLYIAQNFCEVVADNNT